MRRRLSLPAISIIEPAASYEAREVTGTLLFPPDFLAGVVASPDGLTLSTERQMQANIWMVRASK